MNSEFKRNGLHILGSFIDCLDYDRCIQKIIEWGFSRKSRCVSICNVHAVVTAVSDPLLRDAINNSDIATADGMPLVWTMRRNGLKNAQRVCGPDLMIKLLSRLSSGGLPIYFYGSTEKTLQLLSMKLRRRFPDLKVAGFYSPPFRELEPLENYAVIDRINASGAGIVFVGLGCPKQELWMANQKGKINAVMVGVGAAFDFHAGTVRRAPKVLQGIGFEWLYRLMQEPKRLFSRYFLTNTIFIRQVLAGTLLDKR